MKILAGLPRTERGKPISIHGDPKGKTFLYCNGNSIFIRNIEVILNVYIALSAPSFLRGWGQFSVPQFEKGGSEKNINAWGSYRVPPTYIYLSGLTMFLVKNDFVK